MNPAGTRLYSRKARFPLCRAFFHQILPGNEETPDTELSQRLQAQRVPAAAAAEESWKLDKSQPETIETCEMRQQSLVGRRCLNGGGKKNIKNTKTRRDESPET